MAKEFIKGKNYTTEPQTDFIEVERDTTNTYILQLSLVLAVLVLMYFIGKRVFRQTPKQ